MAPKGQKNLQKNLKINTDPIINNINNTNFHVNKLPNIWKKSTLLGFDNKNIAPNDVPDGQIYLQNAGSGIDCIPYIIGNAITNTINNTYLKYDNTLVTLFFFNFGVLILYNNSWINPIGHKYPQIVLPKIIEYNKIIPKIYVGNLVLLSANAFCKDPSGQAPIAPGHE